MSFGGKLASTDVSAATNTLLYAVSGRIGFDSNIRVVNRNDYDVEIRIAIVDGLTVNDLGDDDYIEYDTILRPKGNLTLTGVRIKRNQAVVVYSGSANVSFSIDA